jgi:ATP-dependent Clp protease ATP-binding subunit ClpC
LRTIGIVHEAGEAHPLLLESEAQDQALAELRHALEHNPGRSLLLVGDQGVGKRTVTRRLIERLASEGWTVFEAGAMHILAGQSYIGELEQRLTELLKAISGKHKVLWLVPDLPDLATAGRHKHSRASVLDQVLPHVTAGRVRLLSALVPSAHERLVRTQPQLRNAAVVVRLAATDSAMALDLASRFVAALRADGSAALCDDALLRDIQQRVQLCVGNLAPPGGILHFLKLLHEQVRGTGDPARAATVDDVIALASKMTGLPVAVLDEREGLDLAALRKHFEKRVLGQPEAISCLVDCIAMLKSGLNDPRRPLGVFLFTGPTGTGKTEIARTLPRSCSAARRGWSAST